MLNSTASIQTYTHIHTVITILWPLITWSCTAGDICAVPLSWPAVILSFQNVYNFPAHRHCWQGGALSTLPAPQLMMPPWPSSKQRRFLHSPLTARKQKKLQTQRLNFTKDLFLHFLIMLGHAFLHHHSSIPVYILLLHSWCIYFTDDGKVHYEVCSKTVQQFLDTMKFALIPQTP